MNQGISLYLNSFLFESAFLDGFIYFIAQILPIIMIVFSVGYFLFSKKEKIKSLAVVLVVSFSWALSEILKFIFNKPRPFLYVEGIAPLFVFGSYDSFPSGHAMVFASLSTMMFYENKKIGIIYFILTLFIGLARIFAGVHYLNDILFGLIIGWFVVFLAYKYIGKLRNK